MKIRKKPVVVDAWIIDTAELQYHGNVLDWVHNEYQAQYGRIAVVSDGQKMVLRIRTLEGMMTAQDGDVLVKGVDGEIYSIKWEIFLKTYDVVDEDDQPERESTKIKHINVYDIEDMADGSAIVRMDMDYETMKAFAKRGIYASLVEAAENIVKEHGDA